MSWTMDNIYVEDLTDKTLAYMENDPEMSWEKFWLDFCHGSKVPKKDGHGYLSYIGKRVRLKDAINAELESRKDARRLVCINGKGLKIVNEDEIGQLIVVKRMRKGLNAQLATISIFEGILQADNLPADDKRMLKRQILIAEMTFNSYLGSCMRMRSLPEPAKKRLMAEYGSE